MQSMFRAERRSLSTAPPGEAQPAVALPGWGGAVGYLRARVRPTFLAAAAAIGAACLIALLLAAGQAAAASGPAGGPSRGHGTGQETAGAAGATDAVAAPEAESPSQVASDTSTDIPQPGELICDMGPVTESTPQTGSLLVTLPWGSGRGQVGCITPQEGLARGPEALAIAPDGRIVVLDSVNQRIVILSARGGWETAFPVPLAEPRFIAVDESSIVVLDADTDRRAVTLDWSGRVTQKSPLPLLDSPATGVFLAEGCAWVEVGHARSISLNPKEARSNEGRPLRAGQTVTWGKARLTPGSDPQLTFVESAMSNTIKSSLATSGIRRETRPALRLRTRDRVDHMVGLAEDARGATCVGVRLAEGGIAVTRIPGPETQKRAADAEATTASCDTILLPEPLGLYLGVPYTTAPDGRIFRPEAGDAGYSLWVHSFASLEGETEVTR
ncbi:MAG: hypothetical protein GX604_05930 [Actinobacteria bacterium]|nr:hypothetical protein [Actinomycetota bacterium]